MLRSLVAAAAAVLAAGAGLLAAPEPAQAVSAPVAPAPADPTLPVTASAIVTASSVVHDEMASYTVSVAGFQPGTDSVTLDVRVDGEPYPLGYDETRNISASGTGAWTWPWTAGDPYGSYEFTFTDGAGHTASATIDIDHTPTAPTPAAGTGLMLDAATAPALDQIDAWKSAGAPYAAIGVYIPAQPDVDNRHDKAQTNLTGAWVSAVQGGTRPWHVVPIDVGLQAPDTCQNAPSTFHTMSADSAVAQVQGEAAADSADERSTALGISRTSPIVADIESYRPGCAAAVQAYLSGWTAELHRRGWLAGVYGGPSSVGTDLVAAKAADGAYVLPDVIWAATDNRQPSTSVANLPTASWKVANQYLLGVNRTYGDVTVPVDETSFDWSIWDTTAPSLTMAPAARLVRGAEASFAWSGIDADSGLARYEVRTRRTAAGRATSRWSGISVLAPTRQGHATLSVRRGEQVCVQVRAVDAAENPTPWSSPACSRRVVHDRAEQRHTKRAQPRRAPHDVR